MDPYLAPPTNTLIIDIGSKYTHVGYAGCYCATDITETYTYGNNIIEASVIKNPEQFVEIIKKKVEKEIIDSAIIVFHTSESDIMKESIKRILLRKKILKSFIFLNSAVCETFGHGKLTAAVLSCSAGSSTATVVEAGLVVEFFKQNNEKIDLEKKLMEINQDIADKLNSNKYTKKIKLKETEEVVFPLNELVDVSDIFGCEAKINVNYNMQNYYDLIDKLMVMRDKHNMKKKMG